MTWVPKTPNLRSCKLSSPYSMVPTLLNLAILVSCTGRAQQTNVSKPGGAFSAAKHQTGGLTSLKTFAATLNS